MFGDFGGGLLPHALGRVFEVLSRGAQGHKYFGEAPEPADLYPGDECCLVHILGGYHYSRVPGISCGFNSGQYAGYGPDRPV